MNRVTLNSTDQSLAEFDGELLINAPGNDADGSTGGRWHDITVYHEDGAEMVVAIAYRTQSSTETDQLYATRADDVDDADAALSLYEPGTEVNPEFLNSLPGSDRKRLVGRLVSRYDEQVNSVLSQLETIVAACTK